MRWTGWEIDATFTSEDRRRTAADGQAAEAVAVMVRAGDLDRSDGVLHPLLDERLRDLKRRGVFGAKPGEYTILPALGHVPEPYAVFVGVAETPLTARDVRIASGGVGRALAALQASTAHWLIPDQWAATIGAAQAASAAAEGLLLGLYKRNTASAGGRTLPKLRIQMTGASAVGTAEWAQGFAKGVTSADAVCYARELTNLPSNALTPARFAEEAASLAASRGLEYRVYDEREAEAAGMGGLLAVGRGSVHPPRMIVLRYRGNPDADEWVGLVGKGVTFDAGGISLKPAAGMEEFISDMGGAAAVFGAMYGLAGSGLRVNAVAVVPAAENMPSGSAYKPGDVIRTYSGLTVEVLNTDAEGRIVLADGITTAIREGARKLIDVATLTGAVMHAFGDLTTGAFANDEVHLRTVLDASERAGEYVWPLPAHPEYKRMLRSEVADLKNHGGAWGGAIAGGLFIGAFAQELPWVHLDIGGTAWMWEDRDLEPKGGTGVMVRTLLAWLEAEASASGN